MITVDTIAKNVKPLGEDSIIYEFDDSSKVSELKSQVDFWVKFPKSKNRVRANLAQSLSFAKLSFRLGFLTSGAKLIFARFKMVYPD